MKNSKKVQDAIDRVLEDWKNMSTEEFNKMLDEHKPGDIANMLEEGGFILTEEEEDEQS